ncbi:hypothetical protein MMC18_004044 [Xylographa bjoerkii]|nr:hypothetical protein [Xylographa bjoerkii]
MHLSLPTIFAALSIFTILPITTARANDYGIYAREAYADPYEAGYYDGLHARDALASPGNAASKAAGPAHKILDSVSNKMPKKLKKAKKLKCKLMTLDEERQKKGWTDAQNESQLATCKENCACVEGRLECQSGDSTCDDFCQCR